MDTPSASIQDWLVWSLSPKISAILLTLFISLISPILFHYFLYRQSSSKSQVPSILLLGPSSAGKTCLYTHLASGSPSKTHTSQEPQTATCTLPPTKTAASKQFRSRNDPSAKTSTTFTLTDTPGHGKLRPAALSLLEEPSLRAVVYVADSAALSTAHGVADAANYLYEILMTLQRRHHQAGKKETEAPNLLIAANKSDLFTSLPPHLVRSGLEEEISRIRETSAKGLLVHSDDARDQDLDEREWLGAVGDAKFAFEHMLDAAGVDISVVGGSAVDNKGQGGDVDHWWDWIAEQL